MKNQKNVISLILAITFIIFSNIAIAGGPCRLIDLDSVITNEDFNNFYKSGDYFFGGQPSIEAFDWLKKEGVQIVINLRSERENEKHIISAFNEERVVRELEMKYVSLPMDGMEAYTPSTLEEFTKILYENTGKVFIHCGSCYRVTYLMMAWLIQEDYPIEKIFAFGRKLKYNSPIERLLGEDDILYR